MARQLLNVKQSFGSTFWEQYETNVGKQINIPEVFVLIIEVFFIKVSEDWKTSVKVLLGTILFYSLPSLLNGDQTQSWKSTAVLPPHNVMNKDYKHMYSGPSWIWR